MKADFYTNNHVHNPYPVYSHTGSALLCFHTPLLLNNPANLLLLGVRIVVRLVRLPIVIINLLLRSLI